MSYTAINESIPNKMSYCKNIKFTLYLLQSQKHRLGVFILDKAGNTCMQLQSKKRAYTETKPITE